MQQIAQGHLVPGLDPAGLLIRGKVCSIRVCLYGYHIRKVPLLKGYQRGHNLRGAGWIEPVVEIVCKIHRPILYVKQACRMKSGRIRRTF